MRGAQARGVGQGIGQHQAALGIGIDHFNGFAVQRGNDIALAVAVPLGMFSAMANRQLTRTPGLSRRSR